MRWCVREEDGDEDRVFWSPALRRSAHSRLAVTPSFPGFLNYDRSNKFSDADTARIREANAALIAA